MTSLNFSVFFSVLGSLIDMMAGSVILWRSFQEARCSPERDVGCRFVRKMAHGTLAGGGVMLLLGPLFGFTAADPYRIVAHCCVAFLMVDKWRQQRA